jgi:hypothetical protein
VDEFSTEVHAANKISSISRAIAAKKKTKHKVNQETWNALENHQEQLNLRIGATLRDVQGQLKRGAPVKKAAANVDDEIEASYKGAHLTWPLTQQQVLNMLEHFKYGRSLHYKYCCEVLTRAKKVMGQCSSLVEISLPPDDSVKLTVVGDLHGQLQDLYSIFAINELPSETNWYLFNGDFVDRGECGVEIVMAIMCMKLLYPQSLHFNRGNHESRNQNSWMGFEEEVQYTSMRLVPSLSPFLRTRCSVNTERRRSLDVGKRCTRCSKIYSTACPCVLSSRRRSLWCTAVCPHVTASLLHTSSLSSASGSPPCTARALRTV